MTQVNKTKDFDIFGKELSESLEALKSRVANTNAKVAKALQDLSDLQREINEIANNDHDIWYDVPKK